MAVTILGEVDRCPPRGWLGLGFLMKGWSGIGDRDGRITSLMEGMVKGGGQDDGSAPALDHACAAEAARENFVATNKGLGTLGIQAVRFVGSTAANVFIGNEGLLTSVPRYVRGRLSTGLTNTTGKLLGRATNLVAPAFQSVVRGQATRQGVAGLQAVLGESVIVGAKVVAAFEGGIAIGSVGVGYAQCMGIF